MEIFETETSSDINKLQAAISAGDADKARDLAHRIKGASATIGADKMRDLAAQIESHTRNRNCESAKEFIGELDTELEQCRIYAEATLTNMVK